MIRKNLELTPRKEQIIEILFEKRLAELNYEIGSIIQSGAEPDDLLTDEKENIEEMIEQLQ